MGQTSSYAYDDKDSDVDSSANQHCFDGNVDGDVDVDVDVDDEDDESEAPSFVDPHASILSEDEDESVSVASSSISTDEDEDDDNDDDNDGDNENGDNDENEDNVSDNASDNANDNGKEEVQSGHSNTNGIIADPQSIAIAIATTITPTTTSSSKQTQTTTTASTLSDLLSLTNAEIKARLQMITFTVETIRAANNQILANSISINPINDHDRGGMYSWYQDNTTINKQDGTLTVSVDDHDQGKSHMQVALFMLKVSPTLKLLRFKMVPAKLSENYFWNAVFYLLLNNDQYDAETVTDAGTSNGNANGNANGQTLLNSPQLHLANNSDTAIHTIVAQKDEEIAQLKQQLLQAKAQAQAQAQQTATGGTPTHNGKWIMSKESLEFLSLDDEIKQKLRDGKNKRLADMQEQMKFILDSDHVKDSSGSWNCCGGKDYQGQCSC